MGADGGFAVSKLEELVVDGLGDGDYCCARALVRACACFAYTATDSWPLLCPGACEGKKMLQNCFPLCEPLILARTLLDLQVIRNTLYKAYLEDFYAFTQSLGGGTASVMGEILKFEADRRAINITINSLDTELTKEGRADLYCNFGDLYPEGISRLERAENHDAVRTAVEPYPQYRQLFQDATYSQEKSLEDCFFEYEVKLNKLAFEQQFQVSPQTSNLNPQPSTLNPQPSTLNPQTSTLI